jgi:hypothetical protein
MTRKTTTPRTKGATAKRRKTKGDGLDFNFGFNKPKRRPGRFRNGASWS